MSRYINENAIGTEKEIFYNRVKDLNDYINNESNILRDIVEKIIAYDHEHGNITISNNGGMLSFSKGYREHWSFVNDKIEKSHIKSVNVLDTSNLSDGLAGAMFFGIYYEVELA